MPIKKDGKILLLSFHFYWFELIFQFFNFMIKTKKKLFDSDFDTKLKKMYLKKIIYIFLKIP